MVHDELSKFTLSDADSPKLPDEAEMTAQVEHEAEWTVESSLQVLGGFMLLFNSYSCKWIPIADI